ncbi:MAG: peptidoglycan DD-metalloendopeptidase family protein [Oligoflexia bacterium]|nr:peptidoglycan DD-metalloendopeptidase family protein [Oligoflexia bacterium]
MIASISFKFRILPTISTISIIGIIGMFLLQSISSSFASINKRSYKKELVSKSRAILKIKHEIDKLERELNSKNDAYLQHIEKIKKIDSSIVNTNNLLMEANSRLNKKKESLSKLLRAHIMNNLENNSLTDDYQDIAHDNTASESESLEFLLKKQVLKMNIEQQLKAVNEEQLINENLKKELDLLKERLNEYSQITEALSQLLLEMENKKIELAQQYNKIDIATAPKIEKVATATATATATESTLIKNNNFVSPLLNFFKVIPEKKGVMFQFKDSSPVYATDKGIVAYSGTLSTYGNIIIIDHGKDIRSVTLGNFKCKLKKNDSVEIGDIVGYTMKGEHKTGNLYFEIRVKDSPQNISSWFQKKELNKI